MEIRDNKIRDYALHNFEGNTVTIRVIILSKKRAKADILGSSHSFELSNYVGPIF